MVTGGTVVAVGAAASTFGLLLGELVWTARRPLPSQVEPQRSEVIEIASARPGTRAVRPLRIVALGDSTLTGPGLQRGEDVWLPRALQQLRLGRAVHYISLAVGGSRSADVVDRITDALRRQPDLVVVAVGSNDILHGVPIRTLQAQLDETVARLLVAVPVVAVANVGDLGNIARVPAPLSSVIRSRASRARRAIERVVASHHRAVLLDVTRADEVFRDRAIFTPDLFHPGVAGHAAWADSVLEDLRGAVDSGIEASLRAAE